MRKIRLDAEDLSVESFDTAAGEGKAGTVRGHSDTYDIDGCNSYYSNCATCLQGCAYNTRTCQASCDVTDGRQICLCDG